MPRCRSRNDHGRINCACESARGSSFRGPGSQGTVPEGSQTSVPTNARPRASGVGAHASASPSARTAARLAAFTILLTSECRIRSHFPGRNPLFIHRQCREAEVFIAKRLASNAKSALVSLNYSDVFKFRDLNKFKYGIPKI